LTASPDFILVLGGLVCVVLPLAAAWTGAYRRLVAFFLLAIASFLLVTALASVRLAWESAPESEPCRQAYIDGVDRVSEIRRNVLLSLCGPIVGLALLTLGPSRRSTSSDDAA